MKLLFYTCSLGRGGAERVMTNLAKQFSDEGYDVVFALEDKFEFEYPLPNNVKKIYFNIDKNKNKIFKHFLRYKNFCKILKSENPNIILSFLCRPNLYSAISKLLFRNRKVYVSVRNVPEIEYPGKIKQLLAIKLFAKTDGVIFQTIDAQNWFLRKNKLNNSIIIPNQVAEQFFDKSFNGNRKNIVTVGRLDYQKNQDMLIRAFSKIADKTDENLVIYGQGPLKENLENLISELGMSERVKLGGLIEDVPDTIIGSKLFVLSSDFEGSPNALLESIALGIPSISTDCPCGGPKEIIEDGKNGFLVPVGNIDSLAEKMLYVLSLSDSELKCISENAKKSADRYRPEKIFKQWKDFLIGEE